LATIFYSARALADLDRLFDFLAAVDLAAAVHAAEVIVDAVEILERHPHIGRPVRGRLRELVISYGRTGYVALYQVSPGRDRVEVLAIRHQREAGYLS
jgi:plasmid stabilization system protein ParE